MSDSEIEIPGNLEIHFRLNGARPHSKEMYRGFTVYLAEGGPHFDAKDKKDLSRADEWLRAGYYVATWAFNRGRKIIGRPVYFKLDHDPSLTPAAKARARVNAAMADAMQAINDGYEAGWHG